MGLLAEQWVRDPCSEPLGFHYMILNCEKRPWPQCESKASMQRSSGPEPNLFRFISILKWIDSWSQWLGWGIVLFSECVCQPSYRHCVHTNLERCHRLGPEPREKMPSQTYNSCLQDHGGHEVSEVGQNRAGETFVKITCSKKFIWELSEATSSQTCRGGPEHPFAWMWTWGWYYLSIISHGLCVHRRDRKSISCP